MRLGERIVTRGDVAAAIEWLHDNRMLHANPETPEEAHELFQIRARVAIDGPIDTYRAWKAKKAKERTAKKMNKILSLEEERNAAKWYEFRKKRRLRKQQRRELKKGWLF